MSAAPNLSSAVFLALADIRLDGGTQSRAQLNDDTIGDYAQKYIDGVAMPPVVVFYDGSAYWLADGFHRCDGAKEAGKESIVADVRQGSQRDAILFSVGANDSHGLRRTNADKRRAVELLLRDEIWRKWSDDIVAEKCCTSREFVLRTRRELEPVIGSQVERIGRDGKTRRVPERPSATEAPAINETIRPGSSEEDKAKLRVTEAKPDPKQWWACPITGCGKEYSQASAKKFGWIKRGYCDDCEAEPAPEEQEQAEERPSEEPVTCVPREQVEASVFGVVHTAKLETLAAQRNADPEFARMREIQRAVRDTTPTRTQRMLDFVLDGGELALLRLGLDWTVTGETLKSAYRDKSRTAHPDRGGSQEQFVVLNRDRELVQTMLGGA
jgi:hypothetical protein